MRVNFIHKILVLIPVSVIFLAVPYRNFTDCFQQCIILTNRRVGKITSREVLEYVVVGNSFESD
jgi:hypothetical protein